MELSSSSGKENGQDRHVCDQFSCGITRDPNCPLWRQPVYEPGTPEWCRTCSAKEWRSYDEDVGLWERVKRMLGTVADAKKTLTELLHDGVVETVRQVVAEGDAKRRKKGGPR